MPGITPTGTARGGLSMPSRSIILDLPPCVRWVPDRYASASSISSLDLSKESLGCSCLHIPTKHRATPILRSVFLRLIAANSEYSDPKLLPKKVLHRNREAGYDCWRN